MDFESILVPEFNGKQNLDEPYSNEYQKHIGCCCAYKLVCADHTFSKSFKLQLGEDAVYSFINLLKTVMYLFLETLTTMIFLKIKY